ncbi:MULTISPECIES: hypothetical protein [Sphingobacterium]|uniref:ABC transporter permease n=1 Tax=Sphingobacterium tenebrionis TaxID=3111775 RepID=A0ABU8I533_9SPHI|nr:hypothetical protein [Sphingobacterium sp. 1.A.4]
MKAALNYALLIFKGNKSILTSIILVALIGFGILFYFSNHNTLSILSEKNGFDTAKNYITAVQLAERTYFNSAPFLAVLLPFLNLIILQKNIYNPVEFTLPLKTIDRFFGIVIFCSFVFLLNLILILLCNFVVQLYLQFNYLDLAKEGYDKLGYLYTEIPDNSILYNANINLDVLKYSFIFFLFLPIYLVSILYFRKYSRIKSTFIIIAYIFFSDLAMDKLWSGAHSQYINNETYVKAYPFVLGSIAAIFAYISFYYLLKEKEVH